MDANTIEELVIAYGNAMFDCGEHNIDDDPEGYDKLLAASGAARLALLAAIAELGKESAP